MIAGVRIIYFFLTVSLISCGKSYNSDAFNRKDEQRDEAEELQQNFRADMKAVNPSLSAAGGQVLVRLVKDDFRVTLAMQKLAPVVHPQRILSGQNCPGPEADKDGDGIISSAESQAASSTTFISLDGDLTDKREDSGSFPEANLLGTYLYDETASRSRVRESLGTNFVLENRVVMVYGTGEDPTVPVACGELTRITGSE